MKINMFEHGPGPRLVVRDEAPDFATALGKIKSAANQYFGVGNWELAQVDSVSTSYRLDKRPAEPFEFEATARCTDRSWEV